MTLHVYLRATKQAEKKPYLARLTGGGQREWAKRGKASNTQYAFSLPVTEGDVLEARGAVWLGTDGLHAGGYSAAAAFWMVVRDGALFGLHRDQAMLLADRRQIAGPDVDLTVPALPGEFAGLMLPPNVELINDAAEA